MRVRGDNSRGHADRCDEENGPGPAEEGALSPVARRRAGGVTTAVGVVGTEWRLARRVRARRAGRARPTRLERRGSWV